MILIEMCTHTFKENSKTNYKTKTTFGMDSNGFKEQNQCLTLHKMLQKEQIK